MDENIKFIGAKVINIDRFNTANHVLEITLELPDKSKIILSADEDYGQPYINVTSG